MDVSRETTDRLTRYEALLRKWNRAINLVSPSTIDQIATRHIEDSAQILELAPPTRAWLDLGSGGGLPGVVLAILRDDGRDLTLMEADKRKCEFLRTVRRELGLHYEIVQDRIENAPAQAADIISARALAPLPQLLALASRHAVPKTQYLFPKGQSWRSEIEAARETWQFDCDVVPSRTDPAAAILCIRKVSPAP
ncbi:16S rRNA (guanine(527)-N(7))-methyltransferase RsmG [Jannaschia ovalis]|uniref:Ribosomal RNA small subunit methyltransferase G n=1 Tax=Jannaschia ovalis TaxID=3038773 RepID=A0ABY8LIQ7_9RHOB|nr:16S rRNA (guanine(527)-N(7))-methyltransferase RsmG [Jannaschia sp. GRR-S6-38]WGH80295.1 16S rRNA (guanine(527)-N(7))-methyltransferase RsmG [Jannaschia sp. GRR-S6-38]